MAHQRLAPPTALACTILMVTPTLTARALLSASPPESNRRDRRRARRRGCLRRDPSRPPISSTPDRRWSGGTATFVQTGDYLDRGGAVRQILDLLMSLEDQAKSAGGRVEVLLGNHEMMNMLREMTDVSAGQLRQLCGFKVRRIGGRRRMRHRPGSRSAAGWRCRSRSAGLVDVDTPGRLRRALRCDGPTGSIRQMAARAQGRRPGRQHGVHARRIAP